MFDFVYCVLLIWLFVLLCMWFCLLVVDGFFVWGFVFVLWVGLGLNIDCVGLLCVLVFIDLTCLCFRVCLFETCFCIGWMLLLFDLGFSIVLQFVLIWIC